MGPNESILEAAKRECKEEACIDLVNCDKIGIIYFSFTYLDELFEVHVFTSDKWTGNPTETKEMKPQWFRFDEIPYDKMCKDDILWLPYLLHQDPNYFVGAARFDQDNTMLDQCFKSIHGDRDQIHYLLSDQYDKLSLDFSVLLKKPLAQTS